MRSDVEAERFFFEFQFLAGIPFRNLLAGCGFRDFDRAAEEADLVFLDVALRSLRDPDRVVGLGHQTRAGDSC